MWYGGYRARIGQIQDCYEKSKRRIVLKLIWSFIDIMNIDNVLYNYK